jgi:YbbR domain-containing protein
MASFFRRLAENWKLKSLAFALAVLLWVVVSAEEITNTWFSVPLEIQVADARYELLPVDLGEVDVRFAGARGDLLDVAVRRPPLRLVIAQVEAESGTYELHPRMVQLPGQMAVSAIDVRPGSIPLEFIRVDSRVVPIRAMWTDELGPNWSVVDGIRLEPDQVRISGPAARLAGITEVPTQRFALTPDDTLFQRTVALDTTGLQGLELSVRGAEVQARIDAIVDRVIQNVPVDVGPGVTVSPDRVTVRLRGPERIVGGISPTFFRVAVAIDEIPGQLPSEGVLVPLRIDRLRPEVVATIQPPQIRMLPIPTPADTVSPADAGAPSAADTAVATGVIGAE